MKTLCFSLLLLLSLAPAIHAGDFQTFLSERCLDCHDRATKKGDFSIEDLGATITAANAMDWQKVLDQIDRRTMPPEAKAQPSPEERQTALLDLEGRLITHVQSLPARRPTMLRRLNRTEYRHTVTDLLHLNASTPDPTREFPDDTRTHGFPDNGEKLVTSSFLLRQYVEAAEQCITEAIHFEPKPETRRWTLLPPFDRTSAFAAQSNERRYFQRVLKQPQPHESLVVRLNGGGNYHPIDDLREAAPQSGWYSIRIQVEAKFHNAELDPKDPELDLRKQKFPSLWDPAEPIRLSLSTATLEGIDPRNKEAIDYAATYHQSGQRDLAIWDLPDDQPTWLECRVWLNRGEFPRLAFPNGPTDSNHRIKSFFEANKERLLTRDQLEKYEKDVVSGGGPFNCYQWFESPRIRVTKIEFEGPLNDTWPPESHRAVFGDAAYRSDAASDVLQKFAGRAWRLPAAAGEVAPIVKLVRAAERDGLSPEAAIQEGLKAILCSPEFLYREEKGEALTAYELASRLSFFLTSSMPDEALLKRAASGKLNEPVVLRQEAARLLDDPGSDAFVEAMLNGWLAMDKLGTMAPDVRKFAFYYDDDLESAMKTETRLFFRQLLRSNGPVERFLNADYTFINRKLAKHYAIDPELFLTELGKPVEGLLPQDLMPNGNGRAPSLSFAKVPLTDPRRGGLLGHASVLTLTANGVDTSPVIRGIWILENILGTPPSPPPPNVPSIEPDARGTTTIRARLEKHREAASCRGCHQRIDPPGFALESFDAVGRWRGHYDNNPKLPVDASGELGAVKFKDVTGFKSGLLERRDQFARCLVEKLLLHALGRDLELTDRPHIRKIVETAAKDNYRLRDLVLLCVESDIFSRK
ncbi:MAG: DUF1592 domain-containing protein [Roseimicrobium sp.]